MKRELTYEQLRQLRLKNIQRAAKTTGLWIITKPDVEKIFDNSKIPLSDSR